MEIELTKTAIKQLDLLDVKTRQRIYKKLYDLRDSLPNLNLKKLKGQGGDLRLKVGNYRVVYYILNNKIYITSILPRKEVYRNL